MTHEYDDLFGSEEIEAAVTQVLELRRATPAAPLDQHVEMAVHEHFCTCAVDIEDEIEHRRSGIHEAIAKEIRKGVNRRLKVDEGIIRESKKALGAGDRPGSISKRP